MSSLHAAICNERLYQIKVFLTVGIKVNTRDELGRTPLMLACFMTNKRRREIVCKLLLNHGANVKIRDKFERTILMYACATRNEFLLDQLLLYNDDNLNWQDLDGNTCLMYAAIEGDIKVLEKLLRPFVRHGVDLDVSNKNGLTAYLLALRNGNRDCANLLQSSGASHQIFDTTNYWHGNEWLDFHYMLRYKQESLQYQGKARAKSQASQRKRGASSSPLQRQFSVPNLLSGECIEELQERLIHTEAEQAWNTKAASAKIDLDVVAIKHKKYDALNANHEKKKKVGKHPVSDVKGKAAPTGTEMSTIQQDKSDELHEMQDRAIGDYAAFTQQQAQASQCPQALSHAEKRGCPNDVMLSVQPQIRRQKDQLMMLFTEYSLSQIPIPPAIPERVCRMRPFRLIRRTSIEKPKKGCSTIAKAKRGTREMTVEQ